MKDGMLLKDAKSEIEDLKMEVQRLKWVQEQENTEYKQIMGKKTFFVRKVSRRNCFGLTA